MGVFCLRIIVTIKNLKPLETRRLEIKVRFTHILSFIRFSHKTATGHKFEKQRFQRLAQYHKCVFEMFLICCYYCSPYRLLLEI